MGNPGVSVPQAYWELDRQEFLARNSEILDMAMSSAPQSGPLDPRLFFDSMIALGSSDTESRTGLNFLISCGVVALDDEFMIVPANSTTTGVVE